jgi:hypothetical protein
MAVEHYECVFSGTLAGQFVQTVLNVKATIAVPVNAFATALLIAQDIAANGIQSSFAACLPVDYLFTSLRVKKIDGSGGPTAIVLVSDFTDPAGVRAGSISSAQVNPLIIWIGTTTPDKTGRTFIPGVSETDIDDMILVAGLITAYQAFIADWIAGGTIGGVDDYHGCIVHRTTGAPPHVFSSGDLIFAGQVSPLIGTQRKRLHPV